MAKKAKTVFVCQECGYESSKWMGKCICGAWNTMVEEKLPAGDPKDKRRRRGGPGEERTRAKAMTEISASGTGARIGTGMEELDRVLGGGLVAGSLTLISGEPGIGKSTLIMQAADNIARKGGSVLYVTGEESEDQLRLRAERICPALSETFYVLAETNVENITDVIEELNPAFVVIDSIQTMYTSEIESAPGNISQVRTCGNEWMRIGKTRNIPIFLVAHVTKSGELAGPKTVEHMVDCVLSFDGERNQELRLLRSFKNRFGTTAEVGAFTMEETGLQEVKDLSRRFLEDAEEETEGAVVTASYEGTRPLLMEVQALTASTNMNFPRRTAIGIELSRLNMIVAVLERRAGLRLSDQDVYVNIVGGMRPEGTSADLAVALAIYSSLRGKAVSSRKLALGEIGLTGALKPVPNAEKLVREAIRMGLEAVLLPASQAKKIPETGEIRILGARDISQAIHIFFEA